MYYRKLMKTDKKEPLVYVLTLNWNTKEMTIECIHSILSSDYPNFKIVVVDNNSSDGSVIAFKKEFGEEIINLETGENLGYGRGMNFGLTYAAKFNPEYFFIMNNDTKIDPSAISEMVKTAKKYDDNCLVTGKVYHYDRPNILQYVGSRFVDKKYLITKRICKYEIDTGQYDKESERDMIDDIFWLMPAKIFKNVGGYSPYFFMNAEQADLALRVKDKGYKLIYTPNAKIWHKGSLSTGGTNKNTKMTYWNMKSTMIFRFLHLKKKYFILFYFKTFNNIIISLAKGFIKTILGRKSNYLIMYASLRGFLSFSLWLFNRSEATEYNPF